MARGCGGCATAGTIKGRTEKPLTATFIGVVVTALIVGTAAVVLLLMAVAPWAGSSFEKGGRRKPSKH